MSKRPTPKKKPVQVKICGIASDEAVEAVIECGADYAGFVFFEKSPRNVSLELAAELGGLMPTDIQRVALTVDPDDRLLESLRNGLRLDWFQLHGSETPERIETIRLEYGLPVIKALAISGPDDLKRAAELADVADMLLFDAKPPAGAERPGGHAAAFDWTLLQGFTCKVPWMLAGGLTPDNVAEAIALTGAKAVDVSSGVERAPGEKDAALIERFIRAARGG